MDPVPPVRVWNDHGPLASGMDLEDAKHYIKNHCTNEAGEIEDDVYIQDADDEEFELLSTGKWNHV